MLHKEPVSRFALKSWTDGSKHVIANHTSDLEFRKGAALVGTNEELVDFVRDFPYRVGAIYVAADALVLKTMELVRPELEFFQLSVPDKNHAADSQEQNNRRDGANAENSRKTRVRFDQLF